MSFSALAVFSHNALYNLTFYLLTYLLTRRSNNNNGIIRTSVCHVHRALVENRDQMYVTDRQTDVRQTDDGRQTASSLNASPMG